ncbi:hypothetical protein T4D_6362 [Trichinella pseudospiralis]|uniref:Uncharacterized protein n=1 Tax=Trichinella pseudospiralis TaxID=6337 RepID=A0A0V1DRT2_TRIPS|nr:hypothetical protein T4D_6362 [Trichinella pseudospiralis]
MAACFKPINTFIRSVTFFAALFSDNYSACILSANRNAGVLSGTVQFCGTGSE